MTCLLESVDELFIFLQKFALESDIQFEKSITEPASILEGTASSSKAFLCLTIGLKSLSRPSKQ